LDGESVVRKLIGIRKRNSVDFVRRLFAAYQTRTLVTLLDADKPLPEVDGFEPGEIVVPGDDTGWFVGDAFQSDDPDPAQVVFTSGTEGEPKAVVLSQRALSDVVTRLNATMQVDASIREYIGVPVTYSFGLGRCRAVAAAGGKCFIPERGFDPIEIRKMLETGAINAISAVPTLFRLLLEQPAVLGGLGSQVKWIEIGSQYMSRAEKEQMKALFPDAIIVQHYGLTEASRSTFLVLGEAEADELESVGRPVGQVEVRTSDEGRIQIRGPHLALGRVVDRKIVAITDDEGWLTTGDNGHLDSSNLFFGGRADDVINSGGVKVDPGLLEQEVRQALGLESGLAIARIKDVSRGDGFFVGVEQGCTLSLDRVREVVQTALNDRDINAGPSVKVQKVTEIPLTATGKVQRQQLAEMYRPKIDPPKPSSQKAGVLGLYETMFDRQDIGPDQSFQQLGGDSLNYVQMSISLEKELGQLPTDWDKQSIVNLQKTATGSNKRLSVLETNILLRAVAITCVVATHSGAPLFGGGTLLLFFLVGYNLARFKSSAFLQGDIWGPLLSYTKVLLVPYFILTVLFMLYNREFNLDLVLLYTNLTRLNLSQIFPFWFVQVLIQCLLITGVLFLIKPIRSVATRKPWSFAFYTTALLVAVRIAAPYVWDTTYLRNLVPQRFMALLWMGWCCYQANTSSRRFLALVLGLGFAYLDSGFERQAAWISLGIVCVLYLPQVRVPSRLRTGIQIVASATFHIFIFNGVITYALGRVLKVGPVPVIFALGFFGSLAGSWVLDELSRRLHARRHKVLEPA